MSTGDNDPIDFGGRFARQFFNNNWPNIEGDPTSSTPVASDNSICDSGYDSFQARRKSISPIDINNNNNNINTSLTSSVVSTSNINNINNNHSNNSNNNASLIVDSNNNNISLTSDSNINLNTDDSNNSCSNSSNSIKTSNSPSITTSTPTTASASNETSRKHEVAATYQRCKSNSLTPMPLTLSMNQHQQQQPHSSQTGTIATTSSTSLNVSPAIADRISNAPVSTATASALVAAAVAVARSAISTSRRSNSLFSTLPSVTTNPWSSQDSQQRINNIDKIERAASLHRTAASFSEPQYTWSGQLPSRSYKNPVYSCKVFLGGVPWDVTEAGLIETFGRFGPVRVQWPGKDIRQPASQTKAGYVYLIYESDRFVKNLLSACTQEYGTGNRPEKYYIQLSSRRMRYKEVEVIPWAIADSNYVRNQFGRHDISRTVFVGALHGMLTAEGLAKIMNDLFGGVSYVGIDSDKYKYPLGSGRVEFNNQRSYMKAISAEFIEVKSSQFNKKIQVDPYVQPTGCSTCHIQNGHIFCRDCLRHFCKTCWNWHHSSESIIGLSKYHRPLMRKKRETPTN